MYAVAKKIVKVEEIAYDPNVSQTTDYVWAKVTLNIDNPAIAVKNLEIPGETIVIAYEYEKLHKHCYHCLHLTHEKTACPWNKGKRPDKRVQVAPKERHGDTEEERVK